MTLAGAQPDSTSSAAPVEPQPSPAALKPETHYPALDGVRGIAILAVFFSHFAGGHKSHNPLIHLWSVVTDAGWTGVDLFFVLSGFLITGILYDSIGKAHHIKNFYIRRALRIFPLFYAVLVVFLILVPILHLPWRPGYWLYFVYLANMTPFLPVTSVPTSPAVIGHFWSLAVEEQFYLLWPFIVWTVKDRRVLLHWCAGIISVAVLLRLGLLYYGTSPYQVYFLLFTRMDSLICGATVALLVRGPAAYRLPLRSVLLGSGLLIVAMFFANGNGLHDNRLIASVGFTIIAIFFSALVYLAWLGTGRFAAICKSNILRFFGRYSYGLYVYHGILVTLLSPLVYPLQARTHSAALGGVLYISLALGLSMLLAYLSFNLMEQPFLRLKSRFA